MPEYIVKIYVNEETTILAENENDASYKIANMLLGDFYPDIDVETKEKKESKKFLHSLDQFLKPKEIGKNDYNGFVDSATSIFLGKELPWSGFRMIDVNLDTIKQFTHEKGVHEEFQVEDLVFGNFLLKVAVYWLEGLNGDETVIIGIIESIKALGITVIHPSKWNLDDDIDYIVIARRVND